MVGVLKALRKGESEASARLFTTSKFTTWPALASIPFILPTPSNFVLIRWHKTYSKSIQSIDFPAVPDMKWCHRSASCPALLGVADSEGHITLLQWDDEAGRLRSSDSVQCAAENILCLSLDWSHRRFPDADPGSLVVSLSDGNLALLQGASAGGLVVTETWHAHDHEPWVAAWDYWDPNRIYSGGDDLLWKCWDIRQGFARAAHTSRRFESGVTSIQSHPHKEHIFAMGSYDSSVYLYDTRKAMTPVSKHAVGGGVWRVKWHPSPTRSNDLLTACMHDGFKVLRYDESGGMEIMKRFDEHESLAYGADWSFAGDDNSGETLIDAQSPVFSDSEADVAVNEPILADTPIDDIPPPGPSLDGMPYLSPSPERNIFTRPLPAHQPTIDPRKNPSFIPPEHSHRTLVLCFDGTGDQFDADNSNIVGLFSLLKKDDKSKQMVYYQSGIGTYLSPQVATPVMSKVQKTLDTMVAWNLDAHVMDGYEFLMQNYTAGDRICIFGFSRGAYTARALAGMLHKVGLLPASNYQQVPFAYKMFTRADPIGWEQSNAFKAAFSIDVEIEFIGVWDTVSSVGLIPKRLPFTTSNTVVRTFRHAVALDERRAKFKANLWNRPQPHEEALGGHSHIKPSTSKPSTQAKKATADSDESGNRHSGSFVRASDDDQMLTLLEKRYSEIHDKPTDIEEVWFAGCHCDVGGGSVSNKTRHSLARISLRWMVRECFKTNTGIMFDTERLKNIGLDPTTLYPFVTPRPPPRSPGSSKISKRPEEQAKRSWLSWLKPKDHQSLIEEHRLIDPPPSPFPPVESVCEEDEELKDALSPKYDQLKVQKFWWVLEFIPMEFRYQTGRDNRWVSYFGANRGRSRIIPKQKSQGFKVHRSVKIRMEAEHEHHDPKKRKRYAPKAKFHAEPIWVS
ncbi:hypothetical protein ONZ45_g886 [Pleurotus djamor]|nr:hypothetical protein ONZ45_g886 [Pleurotus djamor]